MKVIFPLENLHVLSGCSRVLLSVADICKKLGHDVRVMGDRNAAQPGPDESAPVLRHYELEHINHYYPLKALGPDDLDESIDILGLDAHDAYTGADIVWTFSALMDRLEDHVETPDSTRPPPHITLRNHWSYQHWPVTGDYPHTSCTLYANSTYTLEAVKHRWGRPVRLLHPPIPLNAYDPTPTFDERDIDLIYIGRVDPLKLGRPPVLQRFKDLHLLIVGANNEASFPDYHPETTWIQNATFAQLAHNLSAAKAYVHWKGILNRKDPEHLGITVLEAMASGVPTVVPRVGGPWTDIAEEGKYAIGVDNVEEAMKEVHRLTEDCEYWLEWHEKAVEGVKRFGYGVAESKLNKWLEELYTAEG